MRVTDWRRMFFLRRLNLTFLGDLGPTGVIILHSFILHVSDWAYRRWSPKLETGWEEYYWTSGSPGVYQHTALQSPP